ncbi:MAG: threonylcarbamoyl-AMP synthase [Gemmatimonadetes bacterium]|nr:threonylcarbamoyl-AMP synthase [Gemmatimonadota bacterium]
MAIEVLSLCNDSTYSASIQRATEVLAAGGLVAFPTETVYGIGANAADPDAIRRLRELKQRPADKPFTVHVGRQSDVDRFVADVSPIGRRLVAKAWPGPLTLVFPVPDYRAAAVAREIDAGQLSAIYHDGTVGLRCPDSQPACDLLTGVTVPVVAASANPAGGQPALCADEVREAFENYLDWDVYLHR